MPEVQVYALKGDADWAATISNSLKTGVGRSAGATCKRITGRPSEMRI